jgi:hypothetical protein
MAQRPGAASSAGAAYAAGAHAESSPTTVRCAEIVSGGRLAEHVQLSI